MSTIDIRKIRTESGLSQKDFAKKIGVHWRTIQNWEKNGGVPEKVTCVSINPDYPSFEVGFEHIRSVYRVLMCMSLK